MVSELDIRRSAKVLIGQYGDEAPGRAATQAWEFEAKDDVQGHRTWIRIYGTTMDLLSKERPEGKGLH